MTRLKQALLAGVTLLLIISCSNTETLEECFGKTECAITVLCSPNGLGDNGYNDNILEGILRFTEAHPKDVLLYLKSPENLDEARQLYKEWGTESNGLKQRSLLVLVGSDYQSLPTEIPLELTSLQKVLQFEAMDNHSPSGVYTFNLSMYGVSYLAGSVVGEMNLPSTAILVAMPGDPVLEEAIRGYTDGYQERGDGKCDVFYLADDNSGFAMPDSAFRLTNRLADDYWVMYPLLGGSASGVYRYSREVSLTPTIGMDVDCSGICNAIMFSIVRRMDQVVKLYLEDWLQENTWKKHQTFGLETGLTDIVLPAKAFGYWREAVERYRQEAIEKEKAYEKEY